MRRLYEQGIVGFLGILGLSLAIKLYVRAEPAPSITPIAECIETTCTVRIQLKQNGETVLSAPLPFEAYSGEIAPLDTTEGFSHPTGNPRQITAWTIGREEDAIEVAVEMAETTHGGSAILVYQIAGFEHLKRASLVLAPETLRPIATFVESQGLEIITMAPTVTGVTVERTAPDGRSTSKAFRWSAPNTPLALFETN